MVEDGSYQRQESRCADAETTLVSNGHPRAVHWTTVKHPSYVSHLEALADKVPALLAAIEAIAADHIESYRAVEPWASGYKYSGHHCIDDGEQWPCPTVTTLAAALGADTTNQEGTQ